jgi:hypothetical protein
MGVDWTSVVVAFLGVFALSLIAASQLPHTRRKKPEPGPEQQ